MDFWLGLSLSVAFVIGCVAAPLVIPPLSAQQAGGQRWQYFCFNERSAEDVTPLANRAGRDGWEMVAAGLEAWCFKRPL